MVGDYHIYKVLFGSDIYSNQPDGYFLTREHVLLLSWNEFLTMGSGYDTDNREKDMEPVIMVLMLKGTQTFHRYRHM